MIKKKLPKPRAASRATPPKLPPPWDCPWDCRNAEDQRRLEAWTVARIDEIPPMMRWGKSKFEQALEEQPDDPRYHYMLNDPASGADTEKLFSERRKRNRVIDAAKRGDNEAMARLADTPELRRLAFATRHARGREKGEPRPRDTPLSKRLRLEAADNDVNLIYQIWEQHFGKHYRTAAPTAVQIAAKRHGVTEDELKNFRKNKTRRR
jgi:hypothetical protein